MHFSVISLFPDLIKTASQIGVVGQACDRGLVSISTFNPRDLANDVHHTVDDRPFGGGDGMVMLFEPMKGALDQARALSSGALVVHLSPRGEPLTDGLARELAANGRNLILVSSRYAGLDERFIFQHIDREISIGDYILTGGELASLVVIDTVARFIPGVLGNESSAEAESFAADRLEAPQFTRPREVEGLQVPAALLSGDHAKIARWRLAIAACLTMVRRPQLLLARPLLGAEKKEILRLLEDSTEAELELCGLPPAGVLRELLNRWETHAP